LDGWGFILYLYVQNLPHEPIFQYYINVEQLLQANWYGSLEAICLWDFIRRAALFNFFYVTKFRQANYCGLFDATGWFGANGG
jgi:hypothetical protein